VRRVITLPIHRPALSWLLRAQNRTKSIKKIQEMASTASKSLGALFEGDDGTDSEFLRKTFNSVDKDGGGSISREELRELSKLTGRELSEQQLDAALAEMDQDGSGEVDFEEFEVWHKHMGDDEKLVREAFESTDVDGSGYLDKWEMETVLMELGMTTTRVELDEIMAEIDDDGSGEIEFDEFYKWWTEYQAKQTVKKYEDPMANYRRTMFDKACSLQFDGGAVTGDDEISRGDLAALMESLGRELSKAELKWCFSVMDNDDSGSISFEEFDQWYEFLLEGDMGLQSFFGALDTDETGILAAELVKSTVQQLCQMEGGADPDAEPIQEFLGDHQHGCELETLKDWWKAYRVEQLDRMGDEDGQIKFRQRSPRSDDEVGQGDEVQVERTESMSDMSHLNDNDRLLHQMRQEKDDTSSGGVYIPLHLMQEDTTLAEKYEKIAEEARDTGHVETAKKAMSAAAQAAEAAAAMKAIDKTQDKVKEVHVPDDVDPPGSRPSSRPGSRPGSRRHGKQKHQDSEVESGGRFAGTLPPGVSFADGADDELPDAPVRLQDPPTSAKKPKRAGSPRRAGEAGRRSRSVSPAGRPGGDRSRSVSPSVSPRSVSPIAGSLRQSAPAPLSPKDTKEALKVEKTPMSPKEEPGKKSRTPSPNKGRRKTASPGKGKRRKKKKKKGATDGEDLEVVPPEEWRTLPTSNLLDVTDDVRPSHQMLSLLVFCTVRLTLHLLWVQRDLSPQQEQALRHLAATPEMITRTLEESKALIADSGPAPFKPPRSRSKSRSPNSRGHTGSSRGKP